MTTAILIPPRYPLDYTGEAITNLVTLEPHSLNTSRKRVVAPLQAPYFKDSLAIIDAATQEPLTAGQWMPMNVVNFATSKAPLGKTAYDCIVILDQSVSSEVLITYQTVGGYYMQSKATTARLLEELYKDTRPAYWPKVIDKPEWYEPAPHLENPDQLVGVEFLIAELQRLRQVILLGAQVGDDVLFGFIDERAQYLRGIIESLVGEGSAFHAHISQAHAHGVTPDQIGLGKVRNYAIATEEEARAGILPNRYMVPSLVRIFVEQLFSSHLDDPNNPHNLTKNHVNLGQVQNFPVATAEQISNPQADTPAYVTNTVFKPWLDAFLQNFTQGVMADIDAIRANANAALSASQEAVARVDSDITSVVNLSNVAAQNASTALGLAQQCNSNVYASEQLARDLLLVYKDSYSVLNWVRQALPTNLTWSDVVFGNGMFVVTARGTTDKYATSADGATWVLRTLPQVGNWSCTAFGNGRFVMVSASSNVVLHSNSGTSWTAATLPTIANWADVAYGNGKFVAVAYGTQCVHSEDGATWTVASMPKVADWVSITYGNDRFVAVARSSKDVAYSAAGDAWVGVELPAALEWTAVAYGNGRFNVIAALTHQQATSTNGVDWTANSGVAGLASNWQSITYGDGKFLALALDSSKAIMSLDGLKWEERTLLDNQQWVSCAYGNGKFLGVARDTTVLTMSQPLAPV